MKDALEEAGLVGINVVHVTGRGVISAGPRGVGRVEVDMLPKTKLELVVRDQDTQKAIDAIVSRSRFSQSAPLRRALLLFFLVVFFLAISASYPLCSSSFSS